MKRGQTPAEKAEYQAWLEVLRLLKKTGAVTDAEGNASASDIPTTDGERLFVALRHWARRCEALGAEKAEVRS